VRFGTLIFETRKLLLLLLSLAGTVKSSEAQPT